MQVHLPYHFWCQLPLPRRNSLFLFLTGIWSGQPLFRHSLLRHSIKQYGLVGLLLFYIPSAYAQLTMPTSRAVFQRGTDNWALVPIIGNCPANSSTVQAKATPITGGQSVDWTTVGTAGEGSFTGSLRLLAGWYQLEVRSMAGGDQTGYWLIDRMGVGEVILVAGQSNAQGTQDGPDATDDRVSCTDAVNGDIREYQLGFRFRHLDGSATVGPTNNKHFYGALGDLLVHRLNVPVLLLGAAIGGTSSDQYAGSANGQLDVPDLQWWDGQQEMRPYRAIGATLNHYARRTGLRGILWFQGESDNGKNAQDAYVNNLVTVINKSRSDLGFSVPWVIAQTSYISGTTDDNITAAQRRLVTQVSNCFQGPNTDAYGSSYRLSDNTHFSPASMSLLASLWNNALPDIFFAGSAFSLSAPPATITTALPSPARQYAGGHVYVGFMATGPTGTYSVQLLTASGDYITTLGSGTGNPIRVFLPDYLNGNYRVQVVSNVGGNRSAPSETFQVFQNGLSKGSGTGLTAAYFSNPYLSGSPVINRIDGPLDYTWVDPPGSGMPADNRNWSARWTGQIEAPVTGTYGIKSFSDDGTRVWINNELLIDDWNEHPWANQLYGKVHMEAGKRYNITIELLQNWYAAQVRLLWILPNQNKSQYVPIDRLYNTPTTAIQSPVLNGAFSTVMMGATQPVSIMLPANFTDPANLALTYSYAGLPAGVVGNGLFLSGTAPGISSGQFTITATNTAGKMATATVFYQSLPVDNTTPITSTTVGSPTPNPPNGSYTGSFDGADCNGLGGWVYDRNNPNTPLTVDILAGSKVVQTIQANVYRQDLLAAGIGNGLHGIQVDPLPDALKTNSDVPVSLRVTGTDYVIGNTTRTVNCPAALTPSSAPPSNGNVLTANVVNYNCATGQITLGFSGGDGSTVEFMAVGITGWSSATTFTLDYCGATCLDTPPFVIHIRQHGIEGQTVTWSRQRYCAGAGRQGVEPLVQAYRLYPNPVEQETQVDIPDSVDPASLRVSAITPLGTTIDLMPYSRVEARSIKIRLSDAGLPPEQYILHLTGDGSPVSLKFIKR